MLRCKAEQHKGKNRVSERAGNDPHTLGPFSSVRSQKFSSNATQILPVPLRPWAFETQIQEGTWLFWISAKTVKMESLAGQMEAWQELEKQARIHKRVANTLKMLQHSVFLHGHGGSSRPMAWLLSQQPSNWASRHGLPEVKWISLHILKVPSTLLTLWSYLMNVKMDTSVISLQTEDILRVWVSEEYSEGQHPRHSPH